MSYFNSKNLLALSLIAVLSACSGASQNYDALETEVLAIHDEVMPKMEDIMHYQNQLRQKISSLDSLEAEGVSGNTLAEERLKANDLIQQLNAADSLMMDWMFYYDADSAKALNPEETLRYFENEKVKILDVKTRTLKSLEEAASFVATP